MTIRSRPCFNWTASDCQLRRRVDEVALCHVLDLAPAMVESLEQPDFISCAMPSKRELAFTRPVGSVGRPATTSRLQANSKKTMKQNHMRKLLFIAPLVVLGTVWVSSLGKAQEKTTVKYEYAVLKWDGPDRLLYNMPDRFEVVHLEKKGVKVPGEAQ